MAEPNYKRPITQDQIDLANFWKANAKRKAEAEAKRLGKDPNKVTNYKVDQQNVLDTYGPRSKGNWGRDFWGSLGQSYSQLWNDSGIPQTWRRLTSGKYPWNSNPTITGDEAYKEKLQTGYAPHQLGRQQAIDKYLYFARRDSKDPTKDQLNRYLIPRKYFNQKGGWKSKHGKEIKAIYNRYVEDARKKGAPVATLSQFLAFNTPQVVKAQTEAGANVSAFGGLEAFLNALSAANQAQAGNIKSFSGDFTGGAEAYKNSAQKAQQATKQYEALDPAQKAQYWTSPFALTGAGYLATKMAPGIAAWQAVRYPTSKILHGGAKLLTQNDVALGNAMVNGNIYLLNDNLKARLKVLQEQLGLPEYSQDPKVRQLYMQVGNNLLNRAARVHKGAQIVSDFVPAVVSPSQLVRGGAKVFARQAGKQGIKAAGKKAVITTVRNLPKNITKTVTKPGPADAIFVAQDLARPSEPVSAQHQVMSGQAPIKQYKQQLQAQGIPVTPENIIAMHKAVKAQQENENHIFNGKMGQFAATVGSPWIKGAVQKQIKDQVSFAGLSEQEIEKNFPLFINKQQQAQRDPVKQLTFQKWRQNPQNRAYVKTQFSGLKPKQYLQLFKLNKKRAEKQGAYFPSKVAQDNNTWLTQVAMQAATDNYKKVLSEQDSDKFFADMQEWAPLIYAVGGAQGDSPLKQATQKAIWAHVKKNPFFINKAMSLWALSNGYDSLGSFLGSNGAFYGTLIGLPLTIALMSSLFGGSKQAPQQVPQQVPQQQYQAVAYRPRGITERGLIVG